MLSLFWFSRIYGVVDIERVNSTSSKEKAAMLKQRICVSNISTIVVHSVVKIRGPIALRNVSKASNIISNILVSE